MDGNFGLDLDTVIHHVENADTFSIFFPILRRALVVDLREAPGQGPLIRVMPMARSAADRIRSLKRQRPQLPRPTEVIAIPWATYVENVVSSGVWDRLLRRLEVQPPGRRGPDSQRLPRGPTPLRAPRNRRAHPRRPVPDDLGPQVLTRWVFLRGRPKITGCPVRSGNTRLPNTLLGRQPVGASLVGARGGRARH